jgi:myo-inositol-1(or 4)-monophosphatase
MLGSYKGMMDTAITAATRADGILMDRLGNIRQITKKDEVYKDYVTDVDLQAEEKIITTIRDNYPEHSILSEERGDLHKDSEYKWIIDPLDGTHNYAHNLPMFGVSIALEHAGTVILGVISLPYFNEICVAEKGKGAYINGSKIHVSDVDLGEALMIYDTKLRVNRDPMINSLSKLVHDVFVIRMFGAATWDMCLIAKGQADLSVDFTCKPWDIAAGALIVEEAGGKVTDLQGNPWTPYSNGFIASNGKIHEKVVSKRLPEL